MSQASGSAGDDHGRTDRLSGHGELRTWLGAYLLGELDASTRHRVEEHLDACALCRRELAQLAPLPALLRRALVLPEAPVGTDATPESARSERIAPTSGAGSQDGDSCDPGTSDTHGPPSHVVARARRRVARRRRARLFIAAAALVVAAAGLSAVLDQSTTSARLQRAAASSGSPGVLHLHLAAVESSTAQRLGSTPTGAATLAYRGWGAQVVLEVAHIPEHNTYRCLVFGPGGAQSAGTWLGTRSGNATITAAVALHPQSVDGVEVVTDNGAVVLRWARPPPRTAAAERHPL